VGERLEKEEVVRRICHLSEAVFGFAIARRLFLHISFKIFLDTKFSHLSIWRETLNTTTNQEFCSCLAGLDKWLNAYLHNGRI